MDIKEEDIDLGGALVGLSRYPFVSHPKNGGPSIIFIHVKDSLGVYGSLFNSLRGKFGTLDSCLVPALKFSHAPPGCP